MNQRIRKAVLPVAGLGTRILPAAKTTPKNMLNVFDRPILAHVVAEARAAGIEHIVFVVGRGQGSIEDYFDHAYELEDQLEAKGKADILDAVRADLLEPGGFSVVRQMAPRGLGHAVWCAREIVGDEPFAVILPDMITLPGAKGTRCLAQCIAAYEAHGGNVIAAEEVPEEETHKYGVLSIGKDAGDTFEITGMVEKPPRGEAPSTSIISGRYVLSPEIFAILETVGKGAGGEIQLTDGMKKLGETQAFHGVRFDGKTHDCGSKLGFLLANVAFALRDAEVGADFRREAMALLGGV